METFKQIVIEKNPVITYGIQEKNLTDLTLTETDDVLVKVAYSDINYKDALATQANGGVIREYPQVPGIDLSGEVVKSNSPKFRPGDQVLLTGFGLGVTHAGGFSEYQRVPSDWLVPLPTDLTLKEAMILGTAGFTGILCVNELLALELEKSAAILITGATGGVASCVIAILQRLGYQNLIACTRKTETDWLKELGATSFVSPTELIPEKIRPLAKQRFACVIDTVGGDLLTALLPQLNYQGAAIVCGNAGGIKLDTTILPFILRGIRLIGVDSVNIPLTKRPPLWQQLTELAIAEKLRYQTIGLSEVTTTIDALLNGTHQGRTIIEM